MARIHCSPVGLHTAVVKGQRFILEFLSWSGQPERTVSQTQLGPGGRKFFIYLKEIKNVDSLSVLERQTIAAWRREELVHSGSGEHGALVGRRRHRPGQSATKAPGGRTIIPPPLLCSVVGNTKRKRVG